MVEDRRNEIKRGTLFLGRRLGVAVSITVFTNGKNQGVDSPVFSCSWCGVIVKCAV